MTIDDAIKRYNDNAEYERTHGNLQGCLEFGQLAEWLRDYKRLKKQEPCEDAISREYLVEHIKACWTNGRPMYSPDLSELLSWIDDVPLVQPKPIECEDAISRQEAIDTIRQLYIDLAIQKYVIDILKTLPSVKPQESCDVPDTNVGDIISKQTVLDTISELNAISFYEAQEDSKECYYEIRQAIKDLSSVKPQERTGHWEWVQYDYNPKIGNWHCTECRCIVVECVDKNEKGGIPLYKYCPQCGAKMEVEQNG